MGSLALAIAAWGYQRPAGGGHRLPLAAAPQLWCSQRSGLHQEAARKEQLSF